MENRPSSSAGNSVARTNLLLGGVTLLFVALAAMFAKNLWGRVEPQKQIPLVDQKFLETTPWRKTYADLVKAKDKEGKLAMKPIEGLSDDEIKALIPVVRAFGKK